MIKQATNALHVLLKKHGENFSFPSDIIWQYFDEIPKSTKKPGLIKSFEKKGLIASTGQMTKAVTGARKGSPTKEYTFGAEISSKSLEIVRAYNDSKTKNDENPLEEDNVASSNGIFPLQLPLQRLVHGCPGSGKSYSLAEDASSAHYLLRTVFHPETSYSDFVGGLRPQSIYRSVDPKPVFIGATEDLPGEPVVQYVLQPGPLLKSYRLACLNPNKSVVLIIEEISRGIAAHIFGDTLQLLDRIQSNGMDTGYSQYEIEPRPDVQSWLLYNEIWHEKVKAGFLRFPPNLYIWATMNRADQNAKQLDAAFMRRWKKKYLSYLEAGKFDDFDIKYGGNNLKWGIVRTAVNKRLSEIGNISEDKFVGPYLIPFDHLKDPNDIFEDLWSYLWTDILKHYAPDFFGVKTLAELKDNWNNGEGSPLGDLQA